MAPLRRSLLSLLTLLLCCDPAAADISSVLSSVPFLRAGAWLSPAARSALSRLTVCSGFSECLDAWTCGSPRDYLFAPPASAGSPPRSPPLGVRSAVPLGGLGGGGLELRGDGTFADWTVEGQSTALAADAAHNSKLPLVREALLGGCAGGACAALRVAGALPAGVRGVDGAFRPATTSPADTRRTG